jgi:hypothetical protein
VAILTEIYLRKRMPDNYHYRDIGPEKMEVKIKSLIVRMRSKAVNGRHVKPRCTPLDGHEATPARPGTGQVQHNAGGEYRAVTTIRTPVVRLKGTRATLASALFSACRLPEGNDGFSASCRDRAGL